jgi:hypothetical protein
MEEPTEFVITTKDIQDLVDIATDGATREWTKIIDWIGTVRKNSYVKHDPCAADFAIPWHKGYTTGHMAGENHAREKIFTRINECLNECMYLDDKNNGEGCVGKWEGQKTCKGCDHFTVDTNQLRSIIETPDKKE